MKHSKILASMCLLAVGGLILTGCQNEEPAVKTFDVSFFDAKTLLKTVEVEENGKVERWVPTKEGKTFVDWYLTPSLNRKFDFDTAITDDLSLFAAFKSPYVKDTRDFYILGTGTSEILMQSDWGKHVLPEHKMTKTESETENVYTYTVDLMKDDEFQFAIDKDWKNQRGFGYLTETKLADGKEAFKVGKTIGENSTQRSNIIVCEPGNYTFTLKTNPADDIYETTHPSYTEEGKENYNINPFDTISWVRNGDAKPSTSTITKYFLKGAHVSNWKNMYNKGTELVKGEDGLYTLSRYLNKDEEFMLISTNTMIKSDGTEVTSDGPTVSGKALDDASKELVTVNKGTNMVAKADGEYTITYNPETKKLSLAVDTTKTMVKADYYLDGSFDATNENAWQNYCFNPKFKLAKTTKDHIFELKNVELKADSEIIIQAFKEGATERGEWNTPSYNGLGSYNYTYVFGAGDNFEKVSAKNANIHVKEAGKYNITFDEYAQIITFKDATVEGYDIYIKGGMNGWKHEFKQEYKFAQDATNKDLYTLTIELEANCEFGLAKYDKGVKEGNGDFIGRAQLGTTGDANTLFGTTGNLKSSEAGTYKLSYNAATNKLDISKVTK